MTRCKRGLNLYSLHCGMLDRDDYAQDTPLLSEDREIDPDAAFGGKHARKELEARLLFKLDSRMSILVLIYILNCGRKICIKKTSPE